MVAKYISNTGSSIPPVIISGFRSNIPILNRRKTKSLAILNQKIELQKEETYLFLGDVNKNITEPIKTKVKEAIIKVNEISPIKINGLDDEGDPVRIVSNE